jgi:hypothetical protein
MSVIEIVASTRKKTKEKRRVEQLIPSQLRVDSQALIKLLEDYYEWMNTRDQPSYELNRITEERNLDEAGDKYIELMMKEVAQAVPRIPEETKLWLLKNLVEFYKIRGSNDSIKQFFNVLYRDNVEVYYPGDDMLIPSSGNWDPSVRKPVIDQAGELVPDEYTYGQYLDDGGHPSSTKKIQDSYFYQKFSYVIQTGQNVNNWDSAFRRLIHPAGFKFFGEIAIFLEAIDAELADLTNRAKMPYMQPGFIGPEDFPVIIIALGLLTMDVEVAKTYLIKCIDILGKRSEGGYKESIRASWVNSLHFYDSTPNYQYGIWTTEELENFEGPLWNVGTEITTGAGTGPYDVTFFDDDTITFDDTNKTFDSGSYGTL